MRGCRVLSIICAVRGLARQAVRQQKIPLIPGSMTLLESARVYFFGRLLQMIPQNPKPLSKEHSSGDPPARWW